MPWTTLFKPSQKQTPQLLSPDVVLRLLFIITRVFVCIPFFTPLSSRSLCLPIFLVVQLLLSKSFHSLLFYSLFDHLCLSNSLLLPLRHNIISSFLQVRSPSFFPLLFHFLCATRHFLLPFCYFGYRLLQKRKLCPVSQFSLCNRPLSVILSLGSQSLPLLNHHPPSPSSSLSC